jgi:hypothetical protein
MGLDDDQVQKYRNNGYLFPLDVFGSGQVGFLRAELEQAHADAVKQGLEQKWPRVPHRIYTPQAKEAT